MITKDHFPTYADVKDLDPTFSGTHWGLHWKCWEWYDTLRNKRVLPTVFLKDGSIVKYTSIFHYREGTSRRKRKTHYVDAVSDIPSKCRDMYFKRYFSTGNVTLEAIQQSFRKMWNKEPLKLLEKIRLQNRRRRERERVANFFGKPIELVSQSDVHALIRDDVL